MSENGARIEFADPVFVPDDLELAVPRRGYSRRARVVWRQAKALGLAYVDRYAATVLPIEAARQIRKLKAERDMLARRIKELSDSPI